MKTKVYKFRIWLAEKIIGGVIIKKVDIASYKHEWLKEQLNHGNSVTMGYSVVESIKKSQ